MWILRAARDPGPLRGVLTPPPRRSRRSGNGPRAFSRALLATCCLLALRLPLPAQAQPAAPAGNAAAPAPAQADELILTVTVNGVARGEYTLLRQPGGDFWVRGEDLPRLKLEPLAPARRTIGKDTYYSMQALGASGVQYNEAELALAVQFPTARLEGTVIDLAAPPTPAVPTEPRTSLILSYRLAATNPGQGQSTQIGLDTDANLRLGPLLLRQTARVATGTQFNGFTRGTSQLIWDNRADAQRFTAGDVVSNAGQYGVAMTGAGLMVTKLYDMRPDLIKQPTATLRAATPVPAQVEVSVDGNTIYRGSVGPGPITLDNLLLYGGTRNVQVTVTDASGHREVITQPILFTDYVLAQGFHEYNYFVGRRSELGLDNAWHYKEMAWQGYHRYGVTDSLTVGAGGEGNPDFTTLGGGITLRSDRLGLVSLDLIANHDRVARTTAGGWATRYSYITPHWSMQLGRRQFEPGFRTFLTSPTNPFLRSETRAGASVQLWQSTLSADWVRSEDALGRTDTGILRLAANVTRHATLSGELQNTRNPDGSRDWSAYVFLRYDLDRDRWMGATVRSSPGDRGLDLETGKNLVQGEGVGYRIGTSNDQRSAGGDSGYAFATAKWNLRPLSLEFLGTSATQGGNASYTEVAASGAVVAVDGFWGLTRQVNDSFALARLGVPQPGVQVLLNNQVEGVTDDRGLLFIPDVGAFGNQDISINDRQVGMQYELAARRQTISPAYRSGNVVDFGGKKLSAVAGMAWELADGRRTPIASRAWTLSGPAGTLKVETSNTGDFYLENAQPGTYTGSLQIGRRVYACRVTVPEFPEPVLELKEGIVCE
ncbi:MAG: fimbrial biogenesis outer membrane usher protein [Burkholderiales bacterium]|nr:fimbrial biogenesis outer membrane usher protein [Burkholderiales bacterium]